MSEDSDPQPEGTSSSETLQEQYAEALALLEAEFRDRYTESDPNFQSYLKKEGDPPPIVDNFYSRPSYRDNDRRNSDHRQGHKRRYDDRRHHGGHRQRHDQRFQPYPDQRSYDRRSHHDNRGHYYRDQRQWNQQQHRSGPDSGHTKHYM